jgi:DNA-binding transcriptional MerR regulator
MPSAGRRQTDRHTSRLERLVEKRPGGWLNNDVPDSGLSAGQAARRIGVAATTVRSWDRRYGLGPSRRQPGRHRRYDQHDLARLMLMRRLTSDGVAPAEAARLARETRDLQDLEQAGDAPAPAEREEVRGRGAEVPGRGAEVPGRGAEVPGRGAEVPGRGAEVPGRGTAKGLRRAALALDPGDVDRILDLALSRGASGAWTAVIAPALRHIGSRHAAAGRYIAAEHLLSRAVSAALARVPRPAGPAPILLGCAPEEQHSLPLEALAAALAERGSPSRILGARVPANALRDAIARTGPTAVLVWAHGPATADYQQLTAAAGARPRPAVVAACGPGWEPESLPPGVVSTDNFTDALTIAARFR